MAIRGEEQNTMAAAISCSSSASVDLQDDETDGIPLSLPRRWMRPLSFALHARRRMRLHSLTDHARGQGARRNVEPDAVTYVLEHGRMIRRTGVIFYFLGRKDVPPSDRCMSWATRLEGTTVLQAANGAVITVYRNREGLRTIQRKMKYRLPDLAAWPEDAELRQLRGLWY
jgi:hypothetical protein